MFRFFSSSCEPCNPNSSMAQFSIMFHLVTAGGIIGVIIAYNCWRRMRNEPIRIININP